MRTQLFLSLGLVTLGILMHAGCEPAPCSAGFIGPIDNSDRKAAPSVDNDWLCVEPYDRPPSLPLPDLGGYKPLDEPGPKDMDAVAKAAVFVQSCFGDGIDHHLNINGRIDTIYSMVAAWSLEQGVSDRVQCFKDKANGCEAVRECLGMQAVLRETGAYWLTCYDSSHALTVFGYEGGPWYNMWFNCSGLGLECYQLDNLNCNLPREECPQGFSPYCTENNEPRYCAEIPHDSQTKYNVVHPSCTKVGLTCTTDTETAYCAGSGPSCEFKPNDRVSADFGQGIACEDSNTLRACVNGHEQIVDCSAMAKGFKCIGGNRPHCGADFQCNYDRSNPIPSCNGTVLEICNAGVLTQLDCKSLGFDACDPVRGICKSESATATQ